MEWTRQYRVLGVRLPCLLEVVLALSFLIVVGGISFIRSYPYMNDVTERVDFSENDGESLPLTKCVCGEKFSPWDQVLGVYRDHPWECPKCGAKLYFTFTIRVFQVN